MTTETAAPRPDPIGAWLRFMEAAGVDLTLAEQPAPWPADRPARPLPQASVPAAPVLPPPAARPPTPALDVGPVADARQLAAAAADLDALIATLHAFEGCALKRTAMNLCVGDGDPTSGFMLVGEAPGAEEDRQGKPFVGPSGRLLDRMLAAAGRPRTRAWITNCVFWRPPGNRSPTSQELAMCLPFVERQIELLRPRAVLFVGGIAVRALLNLEEGVTRLRGRKLAYPLADGGQIPATVMFHPAYLLRRPHLKGLAWRDLLAATAMAETG